jgi:tRNA(Glu) U13 pseudouridine synthase TruD
LNTRLRAIRRAALIQPRSLTYTIHEGGNVLFHFSLPAGSYATSILREFMK